MTAIPETHMHLPGPPQGTTYTVTHPDGSTTTITATANPPATAAPTAVSNTSQPLAPEVEAMVRRHEKNGATGTRSREVVAALMERGWTVKPGPKYLRFIYQGPKGKVTLYANSRDLIDRKNELVSKKLPGGEMTASGVRFNYIKDFDTAIKAAASMESLA